MNWEEAKQELVSSVEEPLVSKGYKFLRSPESLLRSSLMARLCHSLKETTRVPTTRECSIAIPLRCGVSIMGILRTGSTMD